MEKQGTNQCRVNEIIVCTPFKQANELQLLQSCGVFKTFVVHKCIREGAYASAECFFMITGVAGEGVTT